VLLKTLEASGARVWSGDFSSDGSRVISATGDGMVVLWGVP